MPIGVTGSTSFTGGLSFVPEVKTETDEVKEQQTLVTRDKAGNNITCVFEDRDGDGKLDLYSLTKIEPSYDGCTHEITYFDLDGNGTFDKSVEKITNHMVDKNGKKIAGDKIIEKEYDTNNKMNNILGLLSPYDAKEVICALLKQGVDFVQNILDKYLTTNINDDSKQI